MIYVYYNAYYTNVAVIYNINQELRLRNRLLSKDFHMCSSFIKFFIIIIRYLISYIFIIKLFLYHSV